MIVIFCDSKYRDFYSCLLIKEQLETLGYRGKVLVVNFHMWEWVTLNNNVEAVVINHAAGTRNKTIIQRMKKMGKKVFVLPTEGRPDSGKPLDFIVSQATHPSVDAYFSWSDLVTERYGEKAFTTGCPRFDIYDDPRFMTTREEFASGLKMNSDLPTISVASNFPQAKFSYQGIEFNKLDWKDLNIDKELGDPEVYARAEYDRQHTFMTLIDAVAAYTKYNFVIKPHPMDDMSLWRTMRTASPAKDRIRVYTHNIHTLIFGSDLLISRQSCMTHLDAALGKIPSVGIIIDSFDTTKDLPNIKYSVDCTLSNNPIGDLMSVISDALQDDFEPRKEMDGYLKKYGFVSDGAANKIATIIANKVGPTKTQPNQVAELLATIKANKNKAGLFNDKNISLEDLRDWKEVLGR